MSLGSELAGKFADGSGCVGVVGLGYVGLPLCIQFAGKLKVLGFDIDQSKIEALGSGRSYIGHIKSETVAGLAASGHFEATGDFSRLTEVDAIVICVPTPLGPERQPDLSYVQRTAETIAGNLRCGQLVSLESTTYPGTTDEVLKPILEGSGLKSGSDFLLCFSPEREDPGNSKFNTGNIPKVVGGEGPEALEAAVALYRCVTPTVVEVSSPAAAEATKILENTYRAINIALVNELKLVFDKLDIDIWEVIEAAKTKPFGFQPFYPGPGWGGHCIPIDPFYLSWKAAQEGVDTRFIELAGLVNVEMVDHVLERTAEILTQRGKKLKGARILILGVAYKPNVDDDRESPALVLMKMFESRGATISYSDPHVAKMHRGRSHAFELESVELTPENLGVADVVLLVTDHQAFDYATIFEHASLIVDTRNAFVRRLGQQVKLSAKLFRV
jgi:UDP-N-acetyl-D-glucosamine dehydrogenase